MKSISIMNKRWAVAGLGWLLLVSGIAGGGVTGSGAAGSAGGRIWKPMLWKIEGGGLTRPAWVFGTIHTGIDSKAPFPASVEKAFLAADVFCGEVSMDCAPQAIAGMLRKDGKTLSQSIGEETAKRLADELKTINPLLDSAPLEPLKTWAVAITVPLLKGQLTGEKPMDARLWDMAGAKGMTRMGLESPQEQLQIFDVLSEEDQVVMLGDTLRQMKETRASGEDPIAGMVKAYLSGDEKALWAHTEKQFADMKDHRELANRLKKNTFTDRDRRFVERLVAKFRETPGKSFFIAVGAGHCVSPDSIVAQLKKAGFTVTRAD